MSVNLINRNPIPGSLGAPVDQGVTLHIQVIGGGNVPLGTVQVLVNSLMAYNASAFQPNFSGTIVSDGLGGWNVHVVPILPFPYDTTITIQVNCTEQPGSIPFSQSYSFKTIRDIRVSVNAEYSEEGDVINLAIYTYEGIKKVPAVVNTGICKIYTASSVPSASPTLLDMLSFDNDRNSSAADGIFNVRFLHPLAVRRNMTYDVSLVVDPYQAPNIGTIVATGVVNFVSKTNAVLISGHKQPDVQGDINLPRVEYEGRHNQAFQVTEADYEKIDLAGSNSMPDLLVDLEFMNGDSYVNILDGELSYSGGGNRLLRLVDNEAAYTLQSQDDFAPLIGARTLLEPTSTNLFPNSAFINTLNPFTLSGTDSNVITESSVIPFIVSSEDNQTPLVNQLHFVFEGLSSYDGITRHASATSPKVSYTSGQNTLISFLVRITYRDSTVTLTNFKLIAQFFNSAGVLVYSSPVTYDPADFVSDSVYSTAEVFVPTGSIPGTATKVGFMIDFDSFEACDRIEVFMVGPSIEYAAFTTSRVVAETATATRLPDALSIAQAKNLNINSGMFVIEYTPLYDGTPPNPATLFDSRLPGSFFNGFVATHRTDGFLEFSIVDSGGTAQTVVSGSAVSLPMGTNVTFSFSWDTTHITIKQATTILGTFTGAYTQPNGINTTLHIGNNANSQNYLLSEVIKFLIYSRPIS